MSGPLVRHGPGGTQCNVGYNFKNPGPVGGTGPAGPTGADGSLVFNGPIGSVLYYTANGVEGSTLFTYDPAGAGGLGKMYFAGVIDPIAIQLTPTTTNPLPDVPGTLWLNSSTNVVQLDNDGVAGATGPPGPVTSYIFDGGTAGCSYTLGPAFDCGSCT